MVLQVLQPSASKTMIFPKEKTMDHGWMASPKPFLPAGPAPAGRSQVLPGARGAPHEGRHHGRCQDGVVAHGGVPEAFRGEPIFTSGQLVGLRCFFWEKLVNWLVQDVFFGEK